MTPAQMKFIFKDADTSEKIKAKFEAIAMTAGYVVHTGRYDKIEVDYDNNLVIVTSIDEYSKREAKQYIDFVDINLVREHYNSPSQAFTEVMDYLSM